eukprot:TRINITY_DN50155_c0_g1_i12.p1 TRINITY_DN50155_c0_g1~~TRINITY_DN50155_c0_g1_i12.p1  ORF type:complete len:248 (+),score=36.35 TRINITY_DN50155_c0_g1_i12:1706-2449(+)
MGCRRSGSSSSLPHSNVSSDPNHNDPCTFGAYRLQYHLQELRNASIGRFLYVADVVTPLFSYHILNYASCSSEERKKGLGLNSRVCECECGCAATSSNGDRMCVISLVLCMYDPRMIGCEDQTNLTLAVQTDRAKVGPYYLFIAAKDEFTVTFENTKKWTSSHVHTPFISFVSSALTSLLEEFFPSDNHPMAMMRLTCFLHLLFLRDWQHVVLSTEIQFQNRFHHHPLSWKYHHNEIKHVEYLLLYE